jgi:hypothetical protein
MNGIIPEMEQIISQLERGTVVTKFFSRKRPEKKTLMIRRETRQIVWSRSATFRPFDGSGKILFIFINLDFLVIYLVYLYRYICVIQIYLPQKWAQY